MVEMTLHLPDVIRLMDGNACKMYDLLCIYIKYNVKIFAQTTATSHVFVFFLYIILHYFGRVSDTANKDICFFIGLWSCMI